VIYRFLVDLLQPYTLLCLLAAAAVVNLWRKRRETRRRLAWATAAVLALLVISTPAFSCLVLGSLEWQYPPLTDRPADAEAIVVLSAGTLLSDSGGQRAALDEDSMLRCLHAADLYRRGGPCPVVVSGGIVDAGDPGPACARLMYEFLAGHGVRAADLVVEDASRTTYENASECRKVLEQHGIRKVVLVTDAVDMFRAERCFRKQGVACVPAPCHYRARFKWSPFTFLPSPGAVSGCQRAWHEWLGSGWYWLQGRI
jgi:uncharacterized SAM-binding protein YcdF (DUF218 family)